MSHSMSDTQTPDLTRFAWLSIAAAITTIGLKSGAYLLTGSVGLLSDAIESLVNLAAAIMALTMLRIAAEPPDEWHAYGHSKAEYFSSALEGLLILIAALAIAWTAIPRLLAPKPIEAIGWGFMISVLASVVNFVVAQILLKAGKTHRSITLEADAHHLLTDVWTSVGVLVAVVLVAVTGWNILDPMIALVVAAQIIWTGYQLLHRSIAGLMDTALSIEDQTIIRQTLARYQQQYGIAYSDLRTRQAGSFRFISVHIQVPGEWTVKQGHDLVDRLEIDITQQLSHSQIITHLEPLTGAIAPELS